MNIELIHEVINFNAIFSYLIYFKINQKKAICALIIFVLFHIFCSLILTSNNKTKHS